MADGDIRCTGCGETEKLTLLNREAGKMMEVRVYRCDACSKVFRCWVELKHVKFRNER